MSGHGQPRIRTAAGGMVKGGPKAARRRKMKGAPRGRAAEALVSKKERELHDRQADREMRSFLFARTY